MEKLTVSQIRKELFNISVGNEVKGLFKMPKDCAVVLFSDEFTADEARTELYKLDNQDEQLNFLCQNNNVYIYN